MNRVPTSYLGCASGIVINQNMPRAMIDRDGVLYGMNHNTDEVKPLTLKKIKDGLSKTMLVGEAFHDFKEQERIGGIRRENAAGDHKDHWAIGSDDIDIHNDLSECLGSTGVPINLPRQLINENPCSRATAPNCQALQLSFSSGQTAALIVSAAMVRSSSLRMTSTRSPGRPSAAAPARSYKAPEAGR